MARMIPSTPPSGHGGGKKAERTLFLELDEQLSDDYVILHSVDYVGGRGADEGEVDFLILHRTEGMLVLECKGSGVRRDDDNRWWRRIGGREQQLDEGPFEQAKGQMHDLADEFQARLRRLVDPGLESFPFVFGYAAAFPLSRPRQVNLPLDVHARTVMFSSDLHRVGEFVRQALAHWRIGRAHKHKLTRPQFDQFLRQVVMPRFEVVTNLGARLDVDRRAFVRLSRAQARTLKGLLSNRRITVPGGAGTGKTVLALEAARQLASGTPDGRRVLLLCFNKNLGKHLTETCQAMTPPVGSVEADYFSRLCQRAIKATHAWNRYPIPSDKEARKDFWNLRAPEALLEALADDVFQPWDALVIDEAQDFHASWWDLIDDLLVDGADGRMAVFYDASQTVFRQACAVPELPAVFPLQDNFRNTRRIASVVQQLGDVDMEPHPDCPEGDEPVIHQQNRDRRKAVKQIEKLVRRLVEHDGVPVERIAILTPHSRPNSCLRGCGRLAGIGLSDQPLDREGRLLHTTVTGFKGLETDVMILADVDPEDEICTRNVRYVGASRARQVLHVYAIGDWLA
jgi:hypothetical protein